jgi:hypothetical protein
MASEEETTLIRLVRVPEVNMTAGDGEVVLTFVLYEFVGFRYKDAIQRPQF